MNTVLIVTDFSGASQHALDYTCQLLQDKDVMLDLLHVFPVPVTYTSDGVALAALGDAIARATDLMDDEVQRIKDCNPGIKIAGRVITGSFLETLREETRLTKPIFMILGTTDFADLYFGDADPLNAMRVLRVPVLFIPSNAEIRPLKRIAYASNYAYVGAQTPVNEIINWVHFTNSSLDVIHADALIRGADDKQARGEAWLRDQIAALNPPFHWIQDSDTLHGISSFLNHNNIDCLVVVPRKYGLWENMFHKSRTKALARFNKIPIMAFHEKDV